MLRCTHKCRYFNVHKLSITSHFLYESEFSHDSRVVKIIVIQWHHALFHGFPLFKIISPSLVNLVLNLPLLMHEKSTNFSVQFMIARSRFHIVDLSIRQIVMFNNVTLALPFNIDMRLTGTMQCNVTWFGLCWHSNAVLPFTLFLGTGAGSCSRLNTHTTTPTTVGPLTPGCVVTVNLKKEGFVIEYNTDTIDVFKKRAGELSWVTRKRD